MQPIMPTPFENRTYMDSHKTHDEQVLSDNNKAEDRYYRERERMYEKEWNEKERKIRTVKRKEKGRYTEQTGNKQRETKE